MKRIACASYFLLLLFSTNVKAQSSIDELMLRNEILATHISGMLEETNGILDRTVDLVLGGEVKGRVMQASLKSFSDDVKGVRAIIVTNGNGELTYDSTRHPIKKVNLSSRKYFLDTIFSGTDDIVITKAIIGKQSNIPFIPIAKRIADPNKIAKGVAIAITAPQGWLDGVNCYDCVIAVFNESGDLLVSNPPGTEKIEGLFQRVKKEKDKGVFKSTIGIYSTISAWQKIPNYPKLTVITTVRSPN